MQDGDCTFMIDAATMFFDFLRIEGWFHSATDRLAQIRLANTEVKYLKGSVGLPHAGVEGALGPEKGFCLEAVVEKTPDLGLVFVTSQGRTIETPVLSLCNERKQAFEGRSLLARFMDDVAERKGARLLDIGGRARSGVRYSRIFSDAECTVFDIVAGDDVDVVGDAHCLSRYFPADSFDAVFSNSVFEHLLMPWVVASEMGRVLRMGGIALILTHQTLGMHDRPWDFWRFSDTAWDSLFNHLTGFEILGRALENPQYIVPHFWSPEQGEHLERAAGYVGSAVLARKVAEVPPRWGQVDLSRILTSAYPQSEEPIPAWSDAPARRWFSDR